MDWGNCLAGDGGNIPTLSCIFPLFQNIIMAALGLAGTVAVIFLIYAGIRLLTSGGDAKKVGSARQTATYAILGLVLVFLSFAIVSFLSTITGVSCIRTFGFNNCGTPQYDPNPNATPTPFQN